MSTQTAVKSVKNYVVLDQMCSLNLDDDVAVDVIEARNDIQAWKAHIVRTINQDRSRVDLLDTENISNTAGDGLGHEVSPSFTSREAVRLVWSKRDLMHST